MFARTARVRRIAAQVLLGWLFALATGLVHACVVAPGLPAVTMEQPEPMDHAGGCPGCPDDEASALTPGACGKFCADESSGVPKAKLALDVSPALGIALVPTAGLWAAEPALRPMRRPGAAPPSLARIPVPIAYLRLTL
ncbi:MAG: hypothetical protein JNL85_07605 [Rubrivivax sp.]|nr:hypothetical protein [Rubrivivax sp.]